MQFEIKCLYICKFTVYYFNINYGHNIQVTGAQSIRNTEDLVVANQVTDWNGIFREILSNPTRDWLRLTLRCILGLVRPLLDFVYEMYVVYYNHI